MNTLFSRASAAVRVRPPVRSAGSRVVVNVLDRRRPDDDGTRRPIGGIRAHGDVAQIVLKTCILPSPAAHGLLYAPGTYRTVAGLIQSFLFEYIDSRLSLGWQLQHLTTEGKWDVKNLAKWQSVAPVSEPIGGVFRALKTLREIDEIHSPEVFARRWKSEIKAVVDISHESPVYDPRGLEDGGIEYLKIPTVSKIPPSPTEVAEFIRLIDRLRGISPTSPTPSLSPPSTPSKPPSADKTAVNDTSSSPSSSSSSGIVTQPPMKPILTPPNPPLFSATDKHSAPARLIGVHCHYGFNRTGFFICSYLIEREGYGVQAAIDEFARGRPKGIKHAHFLDMLWVRYCVGLKRAPTM